MTEFNWRTHSEPRAVIQKTGRSGWIAWEAWVQHGVNRFGGEYGTYSWTRRGAERKAHRLLRRYQRRFRPPPEDVTP